MLDLWDRTAAWNRRQQKNACSLSGLMIIIIIIKTIMMNRIVNILLFILQRTRTENQHWRRDSTLTCLYMLYVLYTNKSIVVISSNRINNNNTIQYVSIL